VTPEQRAKAVAERFASELPTHSVPELERIVTSAIKRALGQQLAELEAWAESSAEYAHGRGKSAKGRDLAAVRIHDEWANRFRRLRNGQTRGVTHAGSPCKG
jgi:hypothetical protein